MPLPKATSTGTTIVGCLFKDGIVLGADTRATEGPIVADKNCEKVCIAVNRSSSYFTTGIIDSLHLGQHSLLWCRHSCRHRVHHCFDRFKHRNARTYNWEETESGYGDDYAQADAFPVRA